MGLFGFDTVEPLTARLAAAALFAIGGVSFLVRNSAHEVYQALLKLKIIWSVAAIIGIVLSIAEGAPQSILFFLGIFVVFSSVWITYLLKIRHQDKRKVFKMV